MNPDNLSPSLDRSLTLAKLALLFGRVNRAIRHPDGVTSESDTDHTVMLGWIAAELCPPGLNRDRVAALALVHDLPEVYAGDTNTLLISAEAREAKRQREDLAVARLRKELHRSPLLPLLAEYEAQRTPEARFVRCLDKLLPKLTHALSGCAAARETTDLDGLRNAHLKQLAELGSEYPEAGGWFFGLLREAMDLAVHTWETDTAVEWTGKHE